MRDRFVVLSFRRGQSAWLVNGPAISVGLLEMNVLETRRRLVVGEGYEGATELQPNRIQRVVERGAAPPPAAVAWTIANSPKPTPKCAQRTQYD
jgi:hypothetical protein